MGNLYLADISVPEALNFAKLISLEKIFATECQPTVFPRSQASNCVTYTRDEVCYTSCRFNASLWLG